MSPALQRKPPPMTPVRSTPPSSANSGRHSLSGFTLLDMLIALACLAVLVSLALPSYQEQVARARRADVQAALLEDAAYMERYYDANNAFTGQPPPALPVTSSPRSGLASYAIAVSVPAAAPTSFVLTATRTGAMARDRCGDFTYDDLGQRALAPGSFASGLSPASCWR